MYTLLDDVLFLLYDLIASASLFGSAHWHLVLLGP